MAAQVTTGLGKVAKEASFGARLANQGKKGVEFAGKFLSLGGHAQQAIPAQHRFFNVMAMVGGWWALDQLRDVVFGVNQVSEGEYVPVKLEDVPKPLRFLHNSIKWDPYSEAPEEQWKGIVHKLFPAVGAGVGAVAGSMLAFELNERAHKYRHLNKATKMNLLEADAMAQYTHAGPLRALTAFFGTFSSASGLTFLYGALLNMSFSEANGSRIFLGALKKGSSGPAKALAKKLEELGAQIKHAATHGGKADDAWAHSFVEQVLQPMFGHELKTKEQQEKAVGALQGIVAKAYHKFSSQRLTGPELNAAIENELKHVLDDKHLSVTLEKEFGLNVKQAVLGAANGTMLDSLGGKKKREGFRAKFLAHHAEAMNQSPSHSV